MTLRMRQYGIGRSWCRQRRGLEFHACDGNRLLGDVQKTNWMDRFIMFHPLALLLYPLVNIQKAMENDPVEIVDLSIKHGDFPYFFVCLPEAKWKTTMNSKSVDDEYGVTNCKLYYPIKISMLSHSGNLGIHGTPARIKGRYRVLNTVQMNMGRMVVILPSGYLT